MMLSSKVEICDKVGFLTAESPDKSIITSGNLADGVCVPGGEEQVPVGESVDRVDMT